MPLFNAHHQHLTSIFDAAVEAANPYHAVTRHLNPTDFSAVRRVFVVGAGKASAQMALAVEQVCGEKLVRGVVAVPQAPQAESKIKFVIGGHPQPTQGSLTAGREILNLLNEVRADDLVVAVISGGGSALMEHLVAGVSLADLQELTAYLLKSGAPINELNCVRKHLSQIKGGGLARACAGRVLTLILSDVIGDPLEVIASGPTVLDPTTLREAQTILQKRNAPARFASLLRETAKDEKIFARVENRLVGSNVLALTAAAQAAQRLGFTPIISSVVMQGEAREFGAFAAQEILKQHASCALIFGGETTVTVRGNGRGGRNSELALSAALALQGTNNIALLCAGTDGIDGASPAAGAFATSETVNRALALGLDPQKFLTENDSFSFFEKLSDAHVIGATGTNVNDVLVVMRYEG